MTSHDKPLRVLVAEALGFTTRDNSIYGCARACVGSIEDDGSFPAVRRTHDHIRWEVSDPQEEADDSWKRCPEYDHPSPDGWSHTGPLIARLHIELAPRWDITADQDTPPSVWDAMSADRRFQGSSPSSPLEAVCNLIVAMRAGGVDVARKLKRGR